MKKENKMTINNLIYALLFLLLGILLLTRFDLLAIASKVIGGVLIVIGIVKIIVYIYMKGKLGDYNLSELIMGLLVIGCGLLLLSYSSALSFAIRTIVGLWILFAGINRIILAISIRLVSKVGFRVYLITSSLMIIIGFCLLTGLVDKIIGILIIGYAITEIVNYIFYKVNFKDEGQVNKKKSNSKIKKISKEKVVDAVIEE